MPVPSSLKLSKIINDPVHGFIEVPRGVILSLIDTPEFQRLRRIKQLGLSSMVYPGAVHTRFNHALGAMHLMRQALEVLKRKKLKISKEEARSALIAILLHDIGHGPFSHALESVIIRGLHHEQMSLALMHDLNDRMDGKLSMAIDIFTGSYHRPFLHQLVSGQLDMDRLDYLIRDSFFTGVAEGVVGIDRITKVLNVLDGNLVVEDKGIYSIEKFIVARRLMYWQVYLHRAAVVAENMLVNILRRARELVETGKTIYLDPNLAFFFHHAILPGELSQEIIQRFIQLDDVTVEYSLQQWTHCEDKVLSDLCQRLLGRRLLKMKVYDAPLAEEQLGKMRESYAAKHQISPEAAAYYIFTGKVSNQAYLEHSSDPIMIWYKSGELKDISDASDIQNIHSLSEPVVKYFLCAPEEVLS
ncbi:MAG: HD domain-containing protein [Bacteroidia bacterium]|nr:HD domain-containing protein [Bacteroidia bacterium]